MKLQTTVNQENAMKDPENFNPQFKPDLSKSQDKFCKKHQGGFNAFLQGVSIWNERRERKVQKMKKETITSKGFQFHPMINPKSERLMKNRHEPKEIKNKSVFSRLHEESFERTKEFQRTRNQSRSKLLMTPLEQLRNSQSSPKMKKIKSG